MRLSTRDAAFRHRAAASSRVVQIPQREQRFIARFHRNLDFKWSKSSVVAYSADVWTNFSTPQQEKAKLRAPRGPHIPEFLVREENYAAKDFIEIGFVWKAVGARGEVFVRVCTSLQDYRVGLPGPRYLLPWSGPPKNDEHPLDATPAPTLYRATVRRAQYKLHNVADERHNAWQTLLEGCHVSAVAKRLRGWRVFMHVGDVPGLGPSDPGDYAKHAVVSTAHHADLGEHAVQHQVDAQTLQHIDAEEVRDFRVFVLGIPTRKPNPQLHDDPINSNSNKHAVAPSHGSDSNKLVDSCSAPAIDGQPDKDYRQVSNALLPPEAPAWLQGATCIGRITDIYRNGNRFYDSGQYIDALGYRTLPGECGVFRVAFQKNLVLHAVHALRAAQEDDAARRGAAEGCAGGGEERLVDLESLQQHELLHVENAEELREFGHLSHGATPLWIRNAPSGLLPLLPSTITHIDYAAEVALVRPGRQWLRDHMAVRMVKKRPPRRTQKAKLSMGGKYLKRVDKAFIKRKGKYASKGRNMRKT